MLGSDAQSLLANDTGFASTLEEAPRGRRERAHRTSQHDTVGPTIVLHSVTRGPLWGLGINVQLPEGGIRAVP